MNDEFDLNRDIDLGVLQVSLDLIEACVEKIRRGELTGADDIRREVAPISADYSMAEQLDEMTAMLAVALQLLAQSTWEPR